MQHGTTAMESGVGLPLGDNTLKAGVEEQTGLRTSMLSLGLLHARILEALRHYPMFGDMLI